MLPLPSELQKLHCRKTVFIVRFCALSCTFYLASNLRTQLLKAAE